MSWITSRTLFTIDPHTGNITTLVTFDREVEDLYNVKIIATDNSPSALFKTGEHNKRDSIHETLMHAQNLKLGEHYRFILIYIRINDLFYYININI